jgi:hypothetical protein
LFFYLKKFVIMGSYATGGARRERRGLLHLEKQSSAAAIRTALDADHQPEASVREPRDALEPVKAGPQHGRRRRQRGPSRHDKTGHALVMQINIDVIKEFLDTVSFVLVTPEFLGEQTLSSIRKFLTNTSPYLYGILGYCGVALIFLTFGIIDSWDIAIYAYFVNTNAQGVYLWLLKVLVLVIVAIMAFVAIILVVYFIVSHAAKLVVRRVMFGVGALLFFSSRAISMWHAWGEHTPAPAETPQHTGAPAARGVSAMDMHSTWAIIPYCNSSNVGSAISYRYLESVFIAKIILQLSGHI